MTNNIQDSTDSQREIQAARESINDIDHSMVDLLQERFKTSARIGQIKQILKCRCWMPIGSSKFSTQSDSSIQMWRPVSIYKTFSEKF